MSNDQQPWGCLLRMFWMMAGNAILLVIAYKIASTGGPVSGFDLVYWLIAILVAVARFVDTRFFAVDDGTEAPATPREMKRHAVWFLSLVGIGWLAIRMVIVFRE